MGDWMNKNKQQYNIDIQFIFTVRKYVTISLQSEMDSIEVEIVLDQSR